MLMIANMISWGLAIYLALGLLFALYFVTVGVRKEPIEGLSLLLRLMFLPAAMLLWPYLLLKGKQS